MQLRVITGEAKNKRLVAPNVEGFRAVQEVAKGSLFSIIGSDIHDSYCLDLFSGSGNLGIEALSRGAAHVDFVDDNYNSIGSIKSNLENCKFEESRYTIHRNEAVKFAGNTEKSYDFIFLDPFYDDTSHIFLMQMIEQVLKPEGVVAFFHGSNLDMQKMISKTQLKIQDERKFGSSLLTILTK